MIQLFHPRYEVEECVEAIRRVLENGWTGTGPECASLEQEWSRFTGARNSLFLNSATAALHIALRMCSLPAGSKVATTPLTFVSTNAVILYENLIPVFCDVDSHDLSLSADSVLKAIEAGARAVIWVHYGGSVSQDFYKLMDAVKGMDSPPHVIEDCAHASGAFYRDGTRVGSRVDTISCFSFQAVKNLPTFDSGMLCSVDSDEMDRARRLSWLGIDKSTYARTSLPGDAKEIYKWKYDVPELGFKYNGNDVAAAIARVQLKYLDRDNEERNTIHGWYAEDMLYSSGTLQKHQWKSSHHLVVQFSERREEIMTALKAAGIAPGVHYRPNFEFPVFAPFYVKGQCPRAELQAEKMLSLPNHLRLGRHDVRKISEVVNECFL